MLWSTIGKVFASSEFKVIFLLLLAVAVGGVLAYFWLKKREEKYLRDRSLKLVQGLMYKKSWLRAHETLRREPFSLDYKHLPSIYRLDEMINAMRTIYKAFSMSQRPMDEVQELVDRMHGIQSEIEDVRADADRKIAFLERQYKQMEDAVKTRWLALPPPSNERPAVPAPAAPAEEPPFEEEIEERPPRASGEP